MICISWLTPTILTAARPPKATSRRAQAIDPEVLLVLADALEATICTDTRACLASVRWSLPAHKWVYWLHSSIQFQYLFAPVFRIADELLAFGIDDKIQSLQRNLPDQYRTIIRNLDHVTNAIASLHVQAQPETSED